MPQTPSTRYLSGGALSTSCCSLCPATGAARSTCAFVLPLSAGRDTGHDQVNAHGNKSRSASQWQPPSYVTTMQRGVGRICIRDAPDASSGERPTSNVQRPTSHVEPWKVDASSRAARESGEAETRLASYCRVLHAVRLKGTVHHRLTPPPPPLAMADAAAQYKKQDGTVSISADGKTVAWKSASGALPPLSIAIADIGSMSTPTRRRRHHHTAG